MKPIDFTKYKHVTVEFDEEGYADIYGSNEQGYIGIGVFGALPAKSAADLMEELLEKGTPLEQISQTLAFKLREEENEAWRNTCRDHH